MFVAIDENGNRVMAEDAKHEPEYFCPICHGKVRLKAGSVNATHFAHVNLVDCDDFTSDMSEWHRYWQSLFPEKNREVIVTNDKETHRADVLCYGTVVEFQHSPISEDEFWWRNNFYRSSGYKVVWIFDLIEAVNQGRMRHYDEWHEEGDSGGKFKWLYPYRFLRGFYPQDEKDITIFFQLSAFREDFEDDEDGYMEKVIWVRPDGGTPWGRFVTSSYPFNRTELLEWLKERWLKEKNK